MIKTVFGKLGETGVAEETRKNPLFRPLDRPGLLTPEDSEDIRARVVVLAPGEETHEHDSGDKEEVLFFLEGNATLTISGKPEQVPAGNAVFIPKNTVHGIKNNSKKPARYVYARSFEKTQKKGSEHHH